MSASTVLSALLSDGIQLDITDHGTLRYRGDQASIDRWLPTIRAYKAELLALLATPANDPPDIRYAPPERLESDRRTCAECLALESDGRCGAARRRQLPGAAPWFSPDPETLHRCIGYRPGPDDQDQRPGRERWPGLARRLLGARKVAA